MRILHVTESLGRGGKERQIAELMSGLSDHQGVSSFIVVTDAEEFHYHVSRQSAQVIPLVRQSKRDLRLFKRLYDVVRDLNIDVVHSWSSMCSVYAAPVTKLCGVALINGFVRDAPPNITIWNKHYFRGKLTIPFSDFVVANSLAGLAAYRIPESKGVCIYNGFSPERISRLTNATELRSGLEIATPHVVGMVANFTPRKDYRGFLEMAARICALRDDVTFVAVGAGETLCDLLASVPKQHSNRIKFLGRRQDVESIVNLFTVGVLVTNTHLHGEGISNAITECMALGKPVVATNDGGTPELVLDGQTGFLVPSHDVGILTDRVLKLLDDSRLADELGMKGRRRIETAFSLGAMTNAYLSLYRQAIDRRKGAVPKAEADAARADACRDRSGGK